MSITDELRNWMENAFTYKTVDGDMFHKVNTPWFGWKRDIEEMLDRIDAELAERYVALPVDADGVPIHVGDRLTDSAEFKSEGVVESLMLEPTGWSAHFGAGWADERIHDWHHHYPPTVEDVLREFAEKVIDSQIPDVHPTYEEAIAEYAAKLRLAGDGE